ncbi:MAG: hypothetical protein GX915_02875 [Clostridiales bacterium]|nr:hypothetical protein [Clostridiales bacterium]
MENILKFIKLAFAGLFFCVGVYFFLNGISTYNKSLSTVRGKIKDDERLYQQNYSNEKTVTYSELISSLFRGLEYDIEIDGFLISKYEHQPEYIINYDIKETNYIKRYFYDKGEKITRIIYTKSY